MNTTTTPVRRFTPQHVAEMTALVEATDGGAYIRVGDVELAIVPPDTGDADRTFMFAVRAHAAIYELARQAPAALADLDALIAELGTPCYICHGHKGHYVPDAFGTHWNDCEVCHGVGRVPAPKVAA